MWADMFLRRNVIQNPECSKKKIQSLVFQMDNTFVNNRFEIILSFKLNVRGKNKKERLGGLFKGLAKGVDEVLLSGQKVKNY